MHRFSLGLMAILAAASVLSACSPSAVRTRPTSPKPMIPAAAPGSIRSSASTDGLVLYLESAAEVTRGAAWDVRLIIVNTGSTDRHFPDATWDVIATQTALPDSIGVGNSLTLGRHPLDLRARASSGRTLQFDGSSTKQLTVGYHAVSAFLSLESTSSAPRLRLRTPPLRVLFK